MATKSICKIDGCGKRVIARGVCAAHYLRWKRHGDPLGGRKTSHGEPKRYFRDVVLPYEGDECLIWPFGRSEAGNGYGKIHYEGKRHVVSRLLCEIVKGPPPSPKHQAAHSCGNGKLGCVAKGHVSWKTRPENEADKLSHGTHNRGERHNMVKLNEAEVREIRALRGKFSQSTVAKMFGVGQMTISDIHTGRSWGWLD